MRPIRADAILAVVALVLLVMWLCLFVDRCYAAPCEARVPVKTGEAAPCDGLLVPDAQAKKAAACLAIDLPACHERRANELEDARIRREAVESLLRVEQEARRGCSVALDACGEIVTEGQGSSTVAWWSRAEVWGLTAGGVVLGVGLTLLVTWAAGAL